MREIFFNDVPLRLVDLATGANLFPGSAEHIVGKYLGKPRHLLNYVDLLDKNKQLKTVTIVHHDLDKLWSDFKSLFKVLSAAGGLIQNPQGQILAIFRRGYWDLPKGKIEAEETPEEAAIREVLEETGIPEVHLGDLITCTWHTYRLRDKRILKKTYWYAMKSPQQFELTPQLEEDIERAEWCNLDDFLVECKPVYKTIELVIERGIKL